MREENFRQEPEPAICAPGTLNKSAERVGVVQELPRARWKAESSGAILGVLWRLSVASLLLPPTRLTTYYWPGTPYDGYLKPSAVSGSRSTTGARFVPARNLIEPGVR